MVAATSQLTSEQKEFIVRKLAAFYTPRDIAQQLAAKWTGTKFNENDILANDPRINLLAPEMHTLYSDERERILLDPHSDPYTDQKARLIALSRQAERYESNNQPAEARQVFRQIAEELGVVGGKAGAKAPDKEADTPGFKAVTVQRSVVRPND
jgi:hypothetical protein